MQLDIQMPNQFDLEVTLKSAVKVIGCVQLIERLSFVIFLALNCSFASYFK